MKKALFIDRDGTLIIEPPVSLQVDTLEQLEFLPGVIRSLYALRKFTGYELVMVTNQDGLGTDTYPEENYESVQAKLITTLRNEGVEFDDILVDRSWPEDGLPTRKPGTGMLTRYLAGEYDLASSWVIGDRVTDVMLARNLGAAAILFGDILAADELQQEKLDGICRLVTKDWDEITRFLLLPERTALIRRKTNETDIQVQVNLDGEGKFDIVTGIGFFDHMLSQVARHSGMDLMVKAVGDLDVDEHHTIEDVAIALGEAVNESIGNKRAMERYGFSLPMDDAEATVLIDFGGRPWIVWNVTFSREKIGEFPSEMFFHFFKSFSDSCRCNLNIKAEGINEHHKAEAIFKAFARAIRMAIRRDPYSSSLPTTKGLL